MTWAHTVYRVLHRILCTMLAHPAWHDLSYDTRECGCGKVRE